MPGEVAPMPKRSTAGPLKNVQSLQDAFDHPEFMARIKQSVPKHMSPDRMLSVFVQSVRKTPGLAKADLMSFLGACIGLASVGLEPNTLLGHAYLIPFEENKWNPQTRQREHIRTNVQVIFGYKGLIELAYRSGQVKSIHADVVWKAEDNPKHFDFHYGSGGKLFHRPLGGEHAENEWPVWAYMFAALKGGDSEAYEVMPISDVLAIRNSAQAYKGALAAYDKANENGWKPPATYTEAPWVKHRIAMIRKTVTRAGTKWLPMSIELAAAVQWDELQERRNPNYGAVIEGAADILDGGLDSLEDYSQTIDTDLGGAFSTKESRQAEPVETKSAAKVATPAQTKQPATSRFSAYLTDEWGEVVGDEYVSAIAYAQALAAIAPKAQSLSTLLEMNTQGIEEATEANSVARKIIEALTAQPTPEQAETKRVLRVDVMDGRNGKPSWPPYVKAVIDSIDATAASEFDAWIDANLEVISQAPDPQRLLVVQAIRKRAHELKCVVPLAVNNLFKPAETTTTSAPVEAPTSSAPKADDPDTKWAMATIAEFRKQTSAEAVRQMGANAAIKARMARFRVEKPEIFEAVNSATAEMLARFEKPQQGQDIGPDSDPDDPGPMDGSYS